MKSPEKYKIISEFEKQTIIFIANINNKYSLNLSIKYNFEKLTRSYEFIIVDDENDKEISLPKTISFLLKPLYFEYTEYNYFIEHNSKEYIQIQLGINLIKSFIQHNNI